MCFLHGCRFQRHKKEKLYSLSAIEGGWTAKAFICSSVDAPVLYQKLIWYCDNIRRMVWSVIQGKLSSLCDVSLWISGVFQTLTIQTAASFKDMRPLKQWRSISDWKIVREKVKQKKKKNPKKSPKTPGKSCLNWNWQPQTAPMLVKLDISCARRRHCVKPQVCLVMLCVAYFHLLHWAQLFVRNNPSTPHIKNTTG